MVCDHIASSGISLYRHTHHYLFGCLFLLCTLIAVIWGVSIEYVCGGLSLPDNMLFIMTVTSHAEMQLTTLKVNTAPPV
jgi:high-affinity Fe2+/Pb2+ permease